LDGIKTTALFKGTNYIKSLTQESLEHLYDVHQKHVDSIQRLPMAPHVLNIDQNCFESTEQGEVFRTTRAWANSLTTTDGKPLQCDKENGGTDKRLSPGTHALNRKGPTRATPIFTQYPTRAVVQTV
jgi:hypothetical protein